MTAYAGPTALWINGRDMGAFSLWANVPIGFLDAPLRQDEPVVARGAGGFIVPSAARIAPREWSIDCVLIASTAAEADSLWSQIKLVLANTWLEVMVEPWTDRILVCRYQRMEPRPAHRTVAGYPLTLTFLAANPYPVAPLVDSYGLTAGQEIPLVLGTAPSPFVVRFIGPATTPTLAYYDANGRVRGSISITGPLNAGDWMEFDSVTLAMSYYAYGGGVTNGIRWLSTASQLFALDPQDGTDDLGPILGLDSGSAIVYTRRAFR